MGSLQQHPMFKKLRKLVRPQPLEPLPAIPAGQRIYAVGDIHGRSDLFDALIAAIEADDAERAAAQTTIILLGDLIDRGPDSAGVIASARALAARRPLRALCGNHEEMFLQSFEDIEVLRRFLRYGGRETIMSYPIDTIAWNSATVAEAQAMMRWAIPEDDLEVLCTFENMIVIGDYLFVHAAIAPGLPLSEQRISDLRWMREPFLSHDGDHGYMVVHGHTISEQPQVRSNRIGIDTGAYLHGRLTALGLDGEERWQLTASDKDGRIACRRQAI
jgi:serine/threonine protein phosphatase 1